MPEGQLRDACIDHDEALQALATAVQQLARQVDTMSPDDATDGSITLRLIDASHSLHRAVIALRAVDLGPGYTVERTSERTLRLLELLSNGSGAVDVERLCDVGAEVTATGGASIMLQSPQSRRTAACSSDGVSALVDAAQCMLGEGPALDAFDHRCPVMEPDLDSPCAARWIAFTETALAAGVAAVFAFPLEVGDVRLGALSLWASKPGSLSVEQHADALAIAYVAQTRAVLVSQANTRPGRLAAELDDVSTYPYVVHQATGMVAAQLEVSTTDALMRLRARAFATGVPLSVVSEDVVARRSRFEARSDGDGKGSI